MEACLFVNVFIVPEILRENQYLKFTSNKWKLFNADSEGGKTRILWIISILNVYCFLL